MHQRARKQPSSSVPNLSSCTGFPKCLLVTQKCKPRKLFPPQATSAQSACHNLREETRTNLSTHIYLDRKAVDSSVSETVGQVRVLVIQFLLTIQLLSRSSPLAMLPWEHSLKHVSILGGTPSITVSWGWNVTVPYGSRAAMMTSRLLGS